MKKAFKRDTSELFISSSEEQEAPQQTKETGAAIPKGYRIVKENKSQRLHILVRPTLKNAIKEEAAEQGLSTNDLINNIFEEYLKRKGKL